LDFQLLGQKPASQPQIMRPVTGLTPGRNFAVRFLAATCFQ
jgi:hypothetical protein